MPTLLLGAAAFLVYSRLDFSPNAATNRIVEFAIAAGALPLPFLALMCGVRTLQYLLAVVWIAPLGVRAGSEVLGLRFGPFGSADYPAGELDIRYPFELSGDFDDGGFEHYLPEEDQLARLLPRILHRRAAMPINRAMLRFLSGDEQSIAWTLRPMLELWRSKG